MTAEFIEKIEAYLEGQISKGELQKLAEAAGIKDKDLDKEIRWFQNSRTAIEAAGLRDQLAEALPKAQKTEAKVRRLRPARVILAIAASALVLVVAWWAITREQQADLYAQFEYKDPGLPVLMSQSEEHQLYDAMTYYSEEDYATTAEKLKDLQLKSPSNDTINYYLGASLLYLGQADEARQTFGKVLLKENSEFREQAQWLQALSAVQEKDYAAARNFLNSIMKQEDHAFFSQAKNLNEAVVKLMAE
jgi:tetratricopeptide (TPR) repeat protein